MSRVTIVFVDHTAVDFEMDGDSGTFVFQLDHASGLYIFKCGKIFRAYNPDHIVSILVEPE